MIHGGIEFGSDNRSIWSASGPQPTAVTLYDLDSKKARIAWPALRSRVHNLAFDAKKNWVVATLNGEQFQGWALWDAAKPNEESISHATADACRAVAVHPQARQLAWAAGKQVHLLDISTKREQPPIELSTEARALRFSADGRLLATIGESVSVWDAPTGRMKFDLMNNNAVCEQVLHFDEEGRIWGIARARDATRTRRQLIRFSVDGQTGDVLIPDLSLTKGRSIGAGALTLDRRLLAVAEASDKPFGPEPIVIWDVKLKRLHQRLSGHWTPIRDLAFSPDGRTIAAIGHFGGALKFWPVPEAPTP